MWYFYLFIYYWLSTDITDTNIQTDGQTDGLSTDGRHANDAIAIPCFALVHRAKNLVFFQP